MFLEKDCSSIALMFEMTRKSAGFTFEFQFIFHKNQSINAQTIHSKTDIAYSQVITVV